MADQPKIVLVHGAYVDASSWLRVVELLQNHRRGFEVVGPQLGLTTLGGDADTVRQTLIKLGDGPKLVVGHSYGGAVISEVDYRDTGVTGLVYIAAYVPDVGESVLSLNGTVPALPSGAPEATLVDNDAQQLSLAPQAFAEYFAPDAGEATARALAVLQRPVGFGAGGASATRAAWKDLPTWYQLSLDDQIISPDLERMFVKRMPNLVDTLELHSGHASPLSHPHRIANFITDAAEHVG